MNPGEKGKIDLKEGWTLENEIAWLEFYIDLNKKVLRQLYSERIWWIRFLDYCRTGK